MYLPMEDPRGCSFVWGGKQTLFETTYRKLPSFYKRGIVLCSCTIVVRKWQLSMHSLQLRHYVLHCLMALEIAFLEGDQHLCYGSIHNPIQNVGLSD